jgi:DNA sulfur modification protein DndB
MLVSFPAMQGVIGQRTYYSCLMKLGAVPKMFTFRDWAEFTPEDRGQRVLNWKRVPDIAKYILDNEDGYIFSSITASYKCRVIFKPVSEESTLGTLEMDFEDANFVINDGQHRCAAIAAAIKENPALAEEAISVLLFPYENLPRVQQMFSDLNRCVVKTSKSLDILYNKHDPMSLVTLEVCQKVLVFKGLVDMDAVSLPVRSPKLFSLSALHDANCELLKEKVGTAAHHEMVAITVDYWTAVSKALPAWCKVKADELKAMDLRQGSISSHSVVLRAIGGIGAELMRDYPDNWQGKLLDLSTVDWSKSNHEWENICIVAGSVVSNRQARLATKAYIKKHMGLPLTEPERRCLPRPSGGASFSDHEGTVAGAPKETEVHVGKNGEKRYVVFGREHVAYSVRDVLVHILEELHKAKPGCLEHIRGGHSRTYVAPTKEALFPGSPHLAEDSNNSRGLSWGWYADVNNSEGTAKIIMERACEAAGVQFGKDVVLQF